ncbi:hypothetical protein LLG10_01200 [bacterium]|nr:hypothetical protein [bacterium]
MSTVKRKLITDYQLSKVKMQPLFLQTMIETPDVIEPNFFESASMIRKSQLFQQLVVSQFFNSLAESFH